MEHPFRSALRQQEKLVFFFLKRPLCDQWPGISTTTLFACSARYSTAPLQPIDYEGQKVGGRIQRLRESYDRIVATPIEQQNFKSAQGERFGPSHVVAAAAAMLRP